MIHTELAGIHEVEVVVSSGAMTFDPVPDFDPEIFEKESKARIAAALRGCGLRVVDAASETLFLEVRHARNHEAGGFVALALSLELREPAALKRLRHAGKSVHALPTVTSWRGFQLILEEDDLASEGLVESAGQLALDFSQTVAQASAYVSGSDADPCLDLVE